MTCTKAREFLAQEDVEIGETADANKSKLDHAAAIAMARQVERVISTKGKKRVELDMRQKPSDEEVLALLLGPTGNIRAPLIRVGKTLVAGFDPDVYNGALSSGPSKPKRA
ncbi:MAG TPA: ArsC family (seleno)protein [Polyangium sp.]|jgi:arsenate reductase-like glutaredoxin family protein|nr:ArsC family (seleno)protein [Polyangium sp.]